MGLAFRQAGLTTRTRQLPPSHKFWEPLPYMQRAVNHLVSRYVAGLPLQPGARKTSITLAAFLSLRLHGRALTMLVIAPKRVCRSVWPAEVAKWTQFRSFKVCFLNGPKKAEMLARAEHDIYLTNPENVRWLCRQYGWDMEKKKYGRPLPFDVVTIDELTKFKNSQSERHGELLPALKGGPRYRWGLTGSLAGDGNYEDVFGQQLLLDQGAALGRFITHYRDKYFLASKDGFGYVLRDPACEQQILERLAPTWFYMDPADYTQLPDVVDDPIYIDFTKEEWRAYRAMRDNLIVELGGVEITAANSGVAYNKLSQLANGAIYDEDRLVHKVHDLKIEALKDLIEELNGVQCLIVYEFNHDLNRLKEAFGGDFPYLGKGATARQEERWINDWNAGRLPYLGVHPASAGHGLNMQESNAYHICWFSLCWSYELYDQTLRRVRRDGNTAARIFNHMLLARGTIDEEKVDARDRKDFTQRRLIAVLNQEILREEREAHRAGDRPTMENEVMVARLSRPGGEVAPQGAAPAGWGQPSVTPPPPNVAGASVQPAGWGAPNGGAMQSQNQPVQAGQAPVGWGAQTQQDATEDQRERIRQTIAPAPQEQVGAAFGAAVQGAAAAIQNASYGEMAQSTQQPAAVQGGTAEAAPARRRRSTASAAEPTQDTTAAAAVLAARVEILKVAFADPSMTIEEGCEVANELWAWASNIG